MKTHYPCFQGQILACTADHQCWTLLYQTPELLPLETECSFTTGIQDELETWYSGGAGVGRNRPNVHIRVIWQTLTTSTLYTIMEWFCFYIFPLHSYVLPIPPSLPFLAAGFYLSIL